MFSPNLSLHLYYQEIWILIQKGLLLIAGTFLLLPEKAAGTSKSLDLNFKSKSPTNVMFREDCDMMHTPHSACNFIYSPFCWATLYHFSVSPIVLFSIFISLYGSKLVSLFLAFSQQQSLWQISISSISIAIRACSSGGYEHINLSWASFHPWGRWRARWRAEKRLTSKQTHIIIWGLRTKPVNWLMLFPFLFYSFFFNLWTINMNLTCLPGFSHIHVNP